MDTTTNTRATFNKRLVPARHVTTGERVVLTAPTGKVVDLDGNGMVTIITAEGFRARQSDIMGAVTFHD